MGGWVGERVEGWLDGWMDGQTHRQVDRRMDRWTEADGLAN